MNERLLALSKAGVSIWLDDLSRERLASGNLAHLIADWSVVGVTTNPTIFAAALSKGDEYADMISDQRTSGASVEDAVHALMVADVQEACDLFSATFERTGGVDGRVSIEVDPTLAHDTEGTLEQARKLWALVDRENVLIKIPATDAGLPAITTAIAEGISVNVTLIFSLERYQQVIDAYIRGLHLAQENGQNLDTIFSVASFFVSRVDAEVDKRLEKLGGDALGLRGKAAIANARLAFELFSKTIGGSEWADLARAGANVQRPLWASTSVKNPEYPDTMYVDQLVTDGVVNTMPQATLDAFADHGEVTGDTIRGLYDDAREHMLALESAGIDLEDVFATLEREGVEKFVKSGAELTETVKNALDGV